MQHIQKDALDREAFIEKLKKTPGNWNIKILAEPERHVVLHHVMIGYINVYPGPAYSDLGYSAWSYFMDALTDYEDTHPELAVRRVQT